ncbi:hypothetical protein HU200_051489 [Digitaria exilis]|uniref:F-box protein AT5G49610-like beta-propeller domain-containing protein n=1 Tax=Digitaria exilis TaxID=1010633 RepID=A0A835AKL5_9POAL|nr:hypothetical protein HU200_051489 [Digitaria exilis]
MALPALIQDVVEEILLYVPPDEPAHPIRAGLVCKAWRGLLSDGGFSRRYRRFHGTPPLLGYIHNVQFYGVPEFVPTTAFSPPLPPPAASNSCRALDCRHGRVLIHETAPSEGFIIWDPITGDRQHLSFPADHDQNLCSFAGAVLCARHGCDHLDCHGGPFLVVYVGMGHIRCTWATVYSSETGAWSAQASISTDNDDNWNFTPLKPNLLIGDAIYISIACPAIRIIKYDFGRHGLSMVDAPQVLGKVAPIEIDGGLGSSSLVATASIRGHDKLMRMGLEDGCDTMLRSLRH